LPESGCHLALTQKITLSLLPVAEINAEKTFWYRVTRPPILVAVLFAMAPTAMFLAGAALMYWKTNLIYSNLPLAHELRHTHYAHLFALGILTAATVIFVVAKWANKKYRALLVLIPVYVFALYSGIFTTTLMIIAAGVLLWVFVAGAFGGLLTDARLKSYTNKFDRFVLHCMWISLMPALVFGFLLNVTANYWPRARLQWQEIRAKGLIADLKDVSRVTELPRIEQALLTQPLKINYQKTYKHRSGDDAYHVTYALVTTGTRSDLKPAEWPIWYYCGATNCNIPKTQVVDIGRCYPIKECEYEFRRHMTTFMKLHGKTVNDVPKGLVLLSKNKDLSKSEDDWYESAVFRTKGLLLFSAFYFFLQLLTIPVRLRIRRAGENN
jgi:hypothetical protein